MATKKNKNLTKSKIVSAAWRLFYEQGYDDTTIEEIVEESGTSKGSFYHYFEGKDALLGSLSIIFDEKYEELRDQMDPDLNAIDALIFLNHELFSMIDSGVALDLLARLFSSQLITRGEKHLLDRNRVYYKLLRKIVCDGQQKGEITKSSTVNDIVRLYALEERAIIYDWCLCNGEYSLREYGQKVIGIYLDSVKN